MKPLDPRLVRSARATAGYLLLVVALAAFATMATVVIAWSLASFVVALFVDGKTLDSQIHLIGYAAITGVIRAVVHFGQEWLGFFASGKVKLELRKKAIEKIEQGGSDLVSKHGVGELSQLLGASLDSLDVYFSKYLPQLVFTALVTPALTALIWFMDQASGLTVLLTLPLIPLFMVMIGYVTRDLQDKQLDALQALNGHFLEIIKGLVTLKIFNRVKHQEQVLLEVSDQYRRRTMKVLRLSFLSGFALELAASLSVALIAVSIGIRLVDGEIALFAGLFILIIAPEVYLPLRNVGAQFHAAAEGVSVSSKVLDLIEEKIEKFESKIAFTPKGLTVIAGPSGIGKTRALRGLISVDSVWMPQTSTLIPGTVLSNICGEQEPEHEVLSHVIELAQLQDVALDSEVSEEALSGGQRQRVALARAFYKLLREDKKLLLLDEPTSQLDALNAERVIAALRKLVDQGVKIVAVTHSRPLLEQADQVVQVGN